MQPKDRSTQPKKQAYRPLFKEGAAASEQERREAFQQQAAEFGQCCQECADYDHAHNAQAEAAFADAVADSTRLFSSAEHVQQAAAEADRVDALLDNWKKGVPPAKRPYRVRREARAIAAAMREPRVSWGG